MVLQTSTTSIIYTIKDQIFYHFHFSTCKKFTQSKSTSRKQFLKKKKKTINAKIDDYTFGRIVSSMIISSYGVLRIFARNLGISRCRCAMNAVAHKSASTTKNEIMPTATPAPPPDSLSAAVCGCGSVFRGTREFLGQAGPQVLSGFIRYSDRHSHKPQHINIIYNFQESLSISFTVGPLRGGRGKREPFIRRGRGRCMK